MALCGFLLNNYCIGGGLHTVLNRYLKQPNMSGVGVNGWHGVV
jgi:hypothetical protein